MGDLSNNDGYVLRELAEEASAILEFGVGASTQILRYYSKGEMLSIDTSQEWIDRTKKRLIQLEVTKPMQFKLYDEPIQGEFDLIFNDGISDKRFEFAINNWDKLKVGGIMAFHDTRSTWGIAYVSDLVKKYFLEIGEIKMNVSNSNITTFKKIAPLKYENWNQTENRQAWRRAKGDFNVQEFLIWKQNENTTV